MKYQTMMTFDAGECCHASECWRTTERLKRIYYGVELTFCSDGCEQRVDIEMDDKTARKLLDQIKKVLETRDNETA